MIGNLPYNLLHTLLLSKLTYCHTYFTYSFLSTLYLMKQKSIMVNITLLQCLYTKQQD